MNHTPGPWAINGGQIEGPGGYPNVVATVGVVNNQSHQDTANARLIAAAPAMLAALRKLVGADNTNYLVETMRYEGLFDEARAAIAQATGQSQAELTCEKRERDVTLVASTAHITACDAAAIANAGLDFPVYDKDDYGWWINITDDPELLAESLAQAEQDGFSPDLILLLRIAANTGCRWLMLDCDGPVYEDLPVHEW